MATVIITSTSLNVVSTLNLFLGTRVNIDTDALGIAWVKNKQYRIELTEGFVKEVGKNISPNPGINNLTTITTNALGPQKTISSPGDNEAFVINNRSLTVTYNRQIEVGTGNIELYQSDDGNVINGGADILIATIAVPSANITFPSATQMRINVLGLLRPNQTYYYLFDAGVVKDKDGFDSEVITNPNAMNYTTNPTDDPFNPFPDLSANITGAFSPIFIFGGKLKGIVANNILSFFTFGSTVRKTARPVVPLIVQATTATLPNANFKLKATTINCTTALTGSVIRRRRVSSNIGAVFSISQLIVIKAKSFVVNITSAFSPNFAIRIASKGAFVQMNSSFTLTARQTMISTKAFLTSTFVMKGSQKGTISELDFIGRFITSWYQDFAYPIFQYNLTEYQLNNGTRRLGGQFDEPLTTFSRGEDLSVEATPLPGNPNSSLRGSYYNHKYHLNNGPLVAPNQHIGNFGPQINQFPPPFIYEKTPGPAYMGRLGTLENPTGVPGWTQAHWSFAGWGNDFTYVSINDNSSYRVISNPLVDGTYNLNNNKPSKWTEPPYWPDPIRSDMEASGFFYPPAVFFQQSQGNGATIYVKWTRWGDFLITTFGSDTGRIVNLDDIYIVNGGVNYLPGDIIHLSLQADVIICFKVRTTINQTSGVDVDVI